MIHLTSYGEYYRIKTRENIVDLQTWAHRAKDTDERERRMLFILWKLIYLLRPSTIDAFSLRAPFLAMQNLFDEDKRKRLNIKGEEKS